MFLNTKNLALCEQLVQTIKLVHGACQFNVLTSIPSSYFSCFRPTFFMLQHDRNIFIRLDLLISSSQNFFFCLKSLFIVEDREKSLKQILVSDHTYYTIITSHLSGVPPVVESSTCVPFIVLMQFVLTNGSNGKKVGFFFLKILQTIKNHWTKHRLVCTHTDAFSIVIPYIDMKLKMLIFLKIL